MHKNNGMPDKLHKLNAFNINFTSHQAMRMNYDKNS